MCFQKRHFLFRFFIYATSHGSATYVTFRPKLFFVFFLFFFGMTKIEPSIKINFLNQNPLQYPITKTWTCKQLHKHQPTQTTNHTNNQPHKQLTTQTTNYTNSQPDKQKPEKHPNIYPHKHTSIQPHRHLNIQKEHLTNSQPRNATNKNRHTQPHKHTDTDKHTNKQTQTNIQTHRHRQAHVSAILFKR